MKAFDLEAAKRGEKIIDANIGEVHFIGATRNQDIMVEVYETRAIIRRPQSFLSMAPKKRTVWVNLYGHSIASYFDTQEEADKSSCGVRIGKAYPMEIEE